MAEIWGAAIAAAGVLGGAYMQGQAAEDAANQANQGQAAGIAEQRAAREQFQQNIAPWLGAGNDALAGLRELMAGDYSGFQDSPDYAYARDQIQQGVERGAAARGSLYSGGTNVDLANALNGIASQNLGSYRNFLTGMATMGQNAAVGSGSAGLQTANSISGMLGQMGANSGNAAIGQANAWSNALGGLSNLAGQYMGQRNTAQAPAAQGATDWGAFAPNTTGANNNWLAGLGSGLNYAGSGGSW